MQKFIHIYKTIHTYLQSDPTRHRLLYPQSPIYHQLSTVYFLLSTIYSLPSTITSMPKSTPTHISTGTSVRQPKTTHTHKLRQQSNSLPQCISTTNLSRAKKSTAKSMPPHISVGTKIWQLRTMHKSRFTFSLRSHTPLNHKSSHTIASTCIPIRISFYNYKKTKHVLEGKAQLLRASLSTTPTAPPPRET